MGARLKKKQVIEICKNLNERLLNYAFLSMGNHNKIYLIKTKNNKNYILKIRNNCQFNNLKRESFFIKKAGNVFAPNFFLFDDSKKILSNSYLVEEFIKMKHFNKRVDKMFLKSIAKWYKNLHNSSFKHKMSFYLYPKYKKYVKNIKKNICKLDKKTSLQLLELFILCDKLFLKYNKIFSKRKIFPIVQGDASVSNIFYNNKKIKFIDWEFADYHLRELDLASFCYSYKLSNLQINFFLNCYYSNNLNKNNLIQFNLILIMHYLKMINWRVERIRLLYNHKLDLKQEASNKIDLYARIQEHILDIKNIIKHSFS
jgi:thiamine kinase-like enzyme